MELSAQSYFIISPSAAPAAHSDNYILFTIFFNVASNVYVTSLYIPPVEDKDVLSQVMNRLAERYRVSFGDFLKTVHLAEAPPGESAWISDNAIFSGKIYLYHENFISRDDLAIFRLLFSHNGADVEFRDPAYLQYKTGAK